MGVVGASPTWATRAMPSFPAASRPLDSHVQDTALIGVAAPQRNDMASHGRGGTGFQLESPIKEALLAILADYPGGQLLSEALQNAEDAGAEQFELTLDLRTHAKGVNDSRLTGPAFILADNGNGFTDREWGSIKRLHDSAKRDSPREIGRFGMGSRSYFHYADTLLVMSNGM